MGEEIKTTANAGQETEAKEQEKNVTNTENQTETTETAETTEEKTFTQADLDKTISERLKRERSKMPPKEELEAFKEWKKSQQTEQERIAEERKELENTKIELQKLKNEKEVLKSGVDSKFTDFVTYEVSKMEGDFAENLENYLKSNAHFKSNSTTIPTTNAGGQKIKNETGKVDTASMSDAEYYKWRQKNKT